MSKKYGLLLSFLLLAAAAGAVAAAVLLGGHISKNLRAVLCGLGGALLGVGVTMLTLELHFRASSPEKQREYALAEHDERNVAIREKAAMDSWYCSLAVLTVLFLAAAFWADTRFMAAVCAAVILHCVFYLVNLGRWIKKI